MTTQMTNSHPKHKKYRLTAFEDEYCWVEDLRNGTPHKCFPLTHRVGDEVWLFEYKTNIFNGLITFRYSVLNLYEVGQVYDFDVISDGERHFMVSSHEHLNLPSPVSLRSPHKPGTEKLLVAGLDLDNNKPLFASAFVPQGPQVDLSQIDYSVFEEFKVYELPVIDRYINKNGNPFLIVVYKGINYHINIPAVYSDIDFGDKIECHLMYYAEGNRYSLKLTRRCIVSLLYTEGDRYSFKIKRFVEDGEQDGGSWMLEDQYGYTNLYRPDNDLSLAESVKNYKEGDTVELYVWKITTKGYLTLQMENTTLKQSQYIVEEIFQEIGYGGQEGEYFYNLIDNEEDDDGEYAGQKHSYLTQYSEGENLWIFSYFSFLDDKIVLELEDGEFVQAKTLLEIYIGLEKWLIYSSDYLKNFLPYRAAAIIEKAESKIASLEAKIDAIDLYLNDGDQKFIESSKNQLLNTRYLPKSKIFTIKELIRVSDFFVGEADEKLLFDTIILLLKNNLLSDWDRFYIAKAVEKKGVAERERIIDLYENEINSEKNTELETLLVFQHLLLFLNSGADNILKLKFASVNLLRFLAIYHNDKEFLKLAIQLIVKNGVLRPLISKHTEVTRLSVEELSEISVFPADSNSFYRGKGRMHRADEGMSLISQNHLIKKSRGDAALIASLSEHNILIKSFYCDTQISSSMEMGDLLNTILNLLIYEKEKTQSGIADYSSTEIYSGRIRAFGNNGSYCFLNCKIGNEPLSTLLHVNSFDKSNAFGDINKFLFSHDKIAFNILNYEGTRATISPLQIIEDYAAKVLIDKIEVKALVIGKFRSKCVLISEAGWPVLIYNDDIAIGDVVTATVLEYNNIKTAFIAVNEVISSDSFDGEPALLYREFLIKAGVIIKNSIEEVTEEIKEEVSEDQEEVLPQDLDFRLTARLLIACLDQYRKSIDDEKENVIYFYVLAVLSSIVKDSKSYYYFGKLENLAQIYKVETAESIGEMIAGSADLESITDNSNITEDVLAFKLLQYFTSDTIDIPIPVESSSRFYKLKKLIEANNLLRSYHENSMWSQYFKNLVIKELYAVALDKEINPIKEMVALTLDSDFNLNQDEKKIVTNLGHESKTREFKTSIFYSASEEPQDSIILRTISGFLNGYDNASLFIGVNDSGDIVGLKKDLQYNPNIRNLDQYQNYLQTLIVNAFPKEVNQHLDFVFHRVTNLDYLEIIIPKYDKPVSFNNEFFQRQGVQTRILKGNDLTDFMFRKASAANNVKAAEVQERSVTEDKMLVELKEDLTDNIQTAEQQLNFDFYSDQKKEGTANFEDITLSEGDLLAYLYIFEDESYILSLSLLDYYLFKIPITEKFRFGYLLMCYDNACVNKVEIRSILSKTFNKKYLNGVSSYGKLMTVLPAKKDSEIIITVARNGHEYIKIMNVNKISTHRILGLKGNCIVQEDIDQVLKYWCNPLLPVDLDPFRRDSKQGLGADVTKFVRMYKILIKYLEA